MTWHTRTAGALVAAIKAQEISSRALLEHFIERVERLNPSINAVVTRDFHRARAAADAADADIAAGSPLGVLHGLPMTVKESFDVGGLATTYGDLSNEDNVATTDGAAVQRLKNAGAIIFGKTNVPIGMTDWQSYNELFGTTNNPWDQSKTAGGSSGGSAACVAAQMAPLELGTDIGGSIRVPSSFCGTFGHKPTYNLVPSTGDPSISAAASSDLSVAGPIAGSADDLALALGVLIDPQEATWSTPGNAAAVAAASSRANADVNGSRYSVAAAMAAGSAGLELSDCRVAVWLGDDVEQFAVSNEVRAVLEQAADALEAAGASVERGAQPAGYDPEEVHMTYLRLVSGVYSQRMTDLEYQELSREIARSYISDCGGLSGEYRPDQVFALRRHQITHREWLSANEDRARLKLSWKSFFDEYDVVLAPCARVAAFDHDHSDATRPFYMPSSRTLVVNGEQTEYCQNLYWSAIANVAHLPSTAFPAAGSGADSDGYLPIGLQCIGAEYSDFKCIKIAGLLHSLLQPKTLNLE